MTAPTGRHSWPESDPIYVPAGSWVRDRWLPTTSPRNGRTRQASWSGAWHLATGDVTSSLHGSRRARAACGYLVRASVDKNYEGQPSCDAVVVDEMPLVDMCLRCVRLSGAKVTVFVRERLVTVTPA